MSSFRMSALVCLMTLSCGIVAGDMPGHIKSVIEEAVREAIDGEDDHCQHITPHLGVDTARLTSVFANEKCEDLCPWCWLCVPKQGVEQCENYCESQCDFKYLEDPRNKRSSFDVCIDKDNKVDVKLAPLEDGVNIVGGLINGGLGQIKDALKDAGNLLAIDKLVGDLTGSEDGPLAGLGKILDSSSSAIPKELVDGIKNGLLDKVAAPVVGSLSSIVSGLFKPSSTDIVLENLTGGPSPNSAMLDKVADDVADVLLGKLQDDAASGILSSVLQNGVEKNKLDSDVTGGAMDSVITGGALDSVINGDALVETVASKIADQVLGGNTASVGSSVGTLKDVVNSDVADKISSNIFDINENNEILKDAVKSAVSEKLASDLLDINDTPDILDVNGSPDMLKEALTSAIADQLTSKILDQGGSGETLTPKAGDLLSTSKLFGKK